MTTRQFVKNLNGHSGCLIELYKDGSNYFVRKSSTSRQYDRRLALQIEKQQRICEIIPLPRVIASSNQEFPCWFEMEFVHGLDFKQWSLSKPISHIPAFLHRLFDCFENLAKRQKNIDLPGKFRAKISSLQDVLSTHQHPRARLLSGKIAPLLDFSFVGMPATECHGDLTLENIIIRSSDDFTFIDSLDGDLESVWLDIAKLAFDAEISWTLRNTLWLTNQLPEHRLLTMISRYVAEEVAELVRGRFPLLWPYLPVLKAIQALRILPYTTDEMTIQRLSDFVELQLSSE